MICLFKNFFLSILFVSTLGIWLVRDVYQWELGFYSHIKRHPEAFSGNCDVLILSPSEMAAALDKESFLAFHYPECDAHIENKILAEQNISAFILDPVVLRRGRVISTLPDTLPVALSGWQKWLRVGPHQIIAKWYSVKPMQIYWPVQIDVDVCGESSCVAAISPFAKISNKLDGCNQFSPFKFNKGDYYFSDLYVGSAPLVNKLFSISLKNLDRYYDIHLKKNRDSAAIKCELNSGLECFRLGAVLSQKYSIRTCLFIDEKYLDNIHAKIKKETNALSRSARLHYKMVQQSYFRP